MTNPSADSAFNHAEAARANEEGVTHHRHGRLDQAEACYRHALSLYPAFPEVLNNLGIIAHARGAFSVAETCFRDALTLKPLYAHAHNNLGNVLCDQSRIDEAHACYREALRIKPDYAEATLNLGNVLMQLSRPREAQDCFRDALKLNPDMTDALEGLCNSLEKTNQTAELRECIANVTDTQCMTRPNLAVIKAKILRRDKKFSEALAVINGIDLSKIAHANVASEVFAIQGDLHDRLGDHANAFRSFTRAKENEAQIFGFHGANRSKYLSLLQAEKEYFTAEHIQRWTQPVFEPNKLVFLVGFPRSGTTLLDSILRSHPDIDVIEEKPMLALVLAEVNRNKTVAPDFLDRLDATALASLRKVYFDELAKHRDRNRPDALVIDKLPLNIAHAGLAHRVFPEAKFILALRDPRDCVLSCFMQTFMPNDAMANFLTIEGAAHLYATVMDLWQRYERVLALVAHQVRYEDIVSDFEATVRSLLAFLNLPWNDAVSKFRETALKRQQIRTPSYHQVVQPIYRRASGRWVNYNAQLNSIFPVLQPWVEAFGYEN